MFKLPFLLLHLLCQQLYPLCLPVQQHGHLHRGKQHTVQRTMVSTLCPPNLDNCAAAALYVVCTRQSVQPDAHIVCGWPVLLPP